MSYGNYNQAGYGQQNPYDNHPSSYDDYRQSDGAYDHDVEMQRLHSGGAAPAPRARGPTALLDDCAAIDAGLAALDAQLGALRAQHSRYLSSSSSSSGGAPADVDALAAGLLAGYRGLGARVARLKRDPASGSARHAAQVGRVDRRLRAAVAEFRRAEAEFGAKVREQQARQYRIVRPGATEEEVRRACEEPGQRVFQQALLTSDRRGQAQSALRAASQRHDALQQVERTLVELARLFEELEAAAVRQEPLVARAEERAEDANEHVAKANVEMGAAVGSARAARRKKWWCLGVAVLILVVIALIIVIWYFTAGPGKK